MLKLSFSDTGSPCNGPMGFPVFCRWSSKNFALSNASGNRLSDKQFVNWWHTAARFEKAWATSTAFHALQWICCRISGILAVVYLSSSLVKKPLSRGKPVTSSWESGGMISVGTRHSGGIESESAACLAFAMSCHVRVMMKIWCVVEVCTRVSHAFPWREMVDLYPPRTW